MEVEALEAIYMDDFTSAWDVEILLIVARKPLLTFYSVGGGGMCCRAVRRAADLPGARGAQPGWREQLRYAGFCGRYTVDVLLTMGCWFGFALCANYSGGAAQGGDAGDVSGRGAEG
jgi:hypothetical protein